MGAGFQKDLRVSRVGPGGSLNAFFFLLIGVISQRLARVRKKGEKALQQLQLNRLELIIKKGLFQL
jgi:hypothetical protein